VSRFDKKCIKQIKFRKIYNRKKFESRRRKSFELTVEWENLVFEYFKHLVRIKNSRTYVVEIKFIWKTAWKLT